MASANKLLVWSGGFDSTSILLQHARRNVYLDTLYIDVANNETKSKIEQKRRKVILSLLERYWHYKIDDSIVSINPFQFNDDSIASLWQPYLWIMGLMQHLSNKHKYNEILFGYICGDNFWHVRRNFEKAFKNLVELVSPQDHFKIPNIVYPIEWSHKEDLLETYIKDDVSKNVFKQTWTCEIPKDVKGSLRACGACNPCLKFSPIKKLFNEKISTNNISSN